MICPQPCILRLALIASLASASAFAPAPAFAPSTARASISSQIALGPRSKSPRAGNMKMVIAPLPAGKRITQPSLLTTAGVTLVGLPLWIFFLIPSAAISQACITVLNKVSPAKKEAVKDAPSDDGVKFPSLSEIKPLKERSLDLVLLGATGFTGRLAAQHLARQYGNSGKVKWALAGRRKEALEKIRQEAADLSGDESVLTVPIIVVDTTDRKNLHKLVDDTRVVVTTAGPFQLYGSNVVEFCAKFGTSYCDITGELDWVRQMIDKFDTTARGTGAKIVNCCGHDSIPWDLTVLELANALKKKGEDLVKAECFDEIKGAPSGGTFATMLHIIKTGGIKTKTSFDPLVRLADGTKSSGAVKNASAMTPKFSKTADRWVGPFFMAGVNAGVVKRSQALLHPGAPLLTYEESAVHRSFASVFVDFVSMGMFFTALMCPPLRMLVNGALPQPGQGPSEKQMGHSFLRITAVGTGSKGSKVQSELYFDKDAGYTETARMLVESGLSIALENARLPSNGGILSPASCQGSVLLERLQATGGTTFSISDLKQ